MAPLMTPLHAEFAAVRRHADELRTWFAREAGWPLHIERDCARLFKRPADLADATRGLATYDRRRYALLCLACAVLERSDPQITLRLLGERLLALAADRLLESRGFTFALQSPHERRELVAVCRSLLELGVLQRVAGDEEGFVRGDAGNADAMHDALYDVHRRVLASLLAAVRGPSTWAADEAPVSLAERLQSLVAEHVPDSDEGRRTALRHHLSRRLLDDPVVYSDTLPDELRGYFANQRGAMANRLCEATSLVPEQRAEGLALVDDSGLLSDVAMPAEGTDAHVTLLVAEHLAQQAGAAVGDPEVATFVASVREHYGTSGASRPARAVRNMNSRPLRWNACTNCNSYGAPTVPRRPCPRWPASPLARPTSAGPRLWQPRPRCSIDTPLNQRPTLPEPTLARWQPLRLGLVELFHYDSEEFWFRDGHLLLRGNNGTGKSKVLSLTLPFLFDAQLKSGRIEPDGDPGKKMAWNLLLGRHERRMGYAWIEFGRIGDDGAPQYLSLGAGLNAVAARPQVDSWFFVLEQQRIGQDLWLTSPQNVVLTRERLKDALQAQSLLAKYKTHRDEEILQKMDHDHDSLGTE